MLEMISVRDTKVAAFLNPTTVRTVAEGIRMFESACKDSKSQFHEHPHDFVLYKVAQFNELNGRIVPCEDPIQLAVASDFVSNSLSV